MGLNFNYNSKIVALIICHKTYEYDDKTLCSSYATFYIFLIRDTSSVWGFNIYPQVLLTANYMDAVKRP
jgi:hypothetical protein